MKFELKSDYYNNLNNIFYKKVLPEPVSENVMTIFNKELAEQLGMPVQELINMPEIFAGNKIPDGWNPIAQAYSGHQFGYFTRLGDGRAVLLGEWEDPQGELWDIQLKGSGRNPYSRGGDGRATTGSMLREYIISEGMNSLGIPSSRSLAVVETGEPVRRQTIKPGAVLTRVSKSHIRVGTFQYAYEVGGSDLVRSLADYVIQRYYKDDDYISFLDKVIDLQAKLVSEWMRVGFIHGVMNTDNVSIIGITFDYGPCAFIDYYNPDEVFSSIDTMGRYKFSNQPQIAKWNLARLVELFVDIFSDNKDEGVEIAQNLLDGFDEKYNSYYLRAMTSKIGIFNPIETDLLLINKILSFMFSSNLDYTNTFYMLTTGDYKDDERFNTDAFKEFENEWEKRLRGEQMGQIAVSQLMERNNPVLIPRNHLVEKAIKLVENEGDYSFAKRLIESLKKPYDYSIKVDNEFTVPMDLREKMSYKTYCGT